MTDTRTAHSLAFTRTGLLGLAVVIALALALRLAGINYSLWNDEVASTKFAGVPLHLLWSDWMVRETNPPLYYTLLQGWIALFGAEDSTLRLMSLVIGCAGIGLVYLLGRRAGEEGTGLLAASLVAVSAQNILYSQQVRGYILGYAAAAAAVFATMQFLAASEARQRWRALLLYAPACTIALYAHTTFVLLPTLLCVFVLALLAARRQWRPAAEWILANALVLLLWAWWGYITVLQAQTRKTIGWIEPPSVPYAVRMTLESYLPWQLGSAQFAVAAVMVAAAGWATWRWRRQPVLLLLPFLAVATPVLLFLLSQRVPVFLNRTVYWSSAPFLVTVAAGLVALRPRWLLAGAVGVSLAATAAGWLAWFPTREIEPWRAVVASLERQAPGATVLVSGKGPLLNLQRYCHPTTCSLAITGLTSPGTDAWASGFAVRGMVATSSTPVLLATRPRVIAVRWMGQDPAQFAPPDLRAAPLPLPTGDRNNIRASVWHSSSTEPPRRDGRMIGEQP